MEDYEKCKCNKHPAIHPCEFNMIIWETGRLDTVLLQEIDATCKICGDKFYFKSTNPVGVLMNQKLDKEN